MSTTLPRVIKRLVDIIVSLGVLLALTPVMAVTALLICLRLGRPVLFAQIRPGLHAKPFKMRKFRTMREAYDDQGRPLPDAQRMTPLGRCLRRTSLDELPELWNVLRGDMSLVGPRPLLMKYLPRYTSEQYRRHEAKPGITGWAQVQGRNAISWEERFALDVEYVDSWSLALDAHILWRTLWTVLSREGISQQGQETMSEFMGTPEAGAHAIDGDPTPPIPSRDNSKE